MKDKQINDLMKLHNACDTLLAETNIKMTKLIDDFNENQEKKYDEDAAFCDTVDLDNKFTELADYVEDYTD
tara:strand:+ start:685 stop:897 length:213 start_codon:yes stop_codon:yes gene_type:complete